MSLYRGSFEFDLKIIKNLVEISNTLDIYIRCFRLNTAQKMKFSINDFFSKRDQIRRKLRIWSHLMTKPLKESFIFCAVQDFHKIDTCCSLNFNKLPG